MVYLFFQTAENRQKKNVYFFITDYLWLCNRDHGACPGFFRYTIP